ncbi:iron ABC transporter permease [Cnuibacter physcomitrellae]|uniref:ABC transporter permease n=1 Tax=Cnuibacter physcomitrellae TaxID=1619308 RepID=UPI00217607AD|nr:iron ABC transporter permease [Cnuibacter physcomitrellae]MCS5498259.1 iron ABC transporter permease [Cnuibacter physcomitrellae]
MTAVTPRPRMIRGLVRGSWSVFDWVTLIVSLLLALLIVGPLAGAVWNIFSGEDGSVADSFAAVFGDGRILQILWNTFYILGIAIVIALVVGTLLAWLNERTNARVGWASDVLPVVSLLVPSTAGAIGWVILASPQVGYVNVVLSAAAEAVGLPAPDLNIFSAGGMIFVFSLYLIPQVYLVVSAAMRNIDPAMEEAARVSGRGTFAVLWTVTVPAVRPAIISGGLLAMVYGLAMFSVPLILGSRADITILTVEIVRLLTAAYPPDLVGAALLSIVLLVALLVVNGISRAVNRSGRFATIGGKNAGQNVYRLGRVRQTLARIVMFGYLVVGCVLPVLALVYVALQPFWAGSFTWQLSLTNFESVFSAGSQTATALVNSLVLAVATATICMALAVIVTYQLGRSRRLSGPLSLIMKLPGIVPHVIVAIAVLSVFAGPPFNLGSTITILLVAYVILYITQASVSAESASLQIGSDLTNASRVAGRGPGSTLRLISLPLMAPGLAAGWVFVFVLVMGDITASVILAGTNNPVVGFTMLSLFQNGTYSTLSAFAAIITLVSMVVVLSALAWVARSRRKLTR